MFVLSLLAWQCGRGELNTDLEKGKKREEKEMKKKEEEKNKKEEKEKI